MLSFKVITEENANGLIDEISRKYPDCDRSDIEEIVLGVFGGMDEDGEAALTLSFDTLLFRIFNFGRYAFLFPFELSADADPRSAIREIGEYAIREELPLVFSDVPSDALSFFSGFRHMDVDAEDDEGSAYRVRIKTECELLCEIPELEYGRVTLNELCEADIYDFARLSRSEKTNRFWGYDYREDAPEAEDGYFLETARAEFSRGVAMSLAVRAGGVLVGEACLFAFDGMGGAKYAVRLLPEFFGRGLGTEASLALFRFARSVGLKRIYASVMEENTASVKMASKLMTPIGTSDGKVDFEINLSELS